MRVQCTITDTYPMMYIYIFTYAYIHKHLRTHIHAASAPLSPKPLAERWGAGVETQKNVRGEIGGWGRVPFNEPYAPSISTIYDEA